MKFTYQIIFNSKQGFVIRVAMILERRGFEIESLAITASETSEASVMTLQVKGPVEKSEQVLKQIAKLIDVIYIEEVKELQYMNAWK